MRHRDAVGEHLRTHPKHLGRYDTIRFVGRLDQKRVRPAEHVRLPQRALLDLLEQLDLLERRRPSGAQLARGVLRDRVERDLGPAVTHTRQHLFELNTHRSPPPLVWLVARRGHRGVPEHQRVTRGELVRTRNHRM